MQAANLLSALTPGLQPQGSGGAASGGSAAGSGQGAVGNVDGLNAGLIAGQDAGTATEEAASPFADALAAAMAAAMAPIQQPSPPPAPAEGAATAEPALAGGATTPVVAPLFVAAALEAERAGMITAGVDDATLPADAETNFSAATTMQAAGDAAALMQDAPPVKTAQAPLPAAPSAPPPIPAPIVATAPEAPPVTATPPAAVVTEAETASMTVQAATQAATQTAAQAQTAGAGGAKTAQGSKAKAAAAENAATADAALTPAMKAAAPATAAVEALTETAVAAIETTDADDAPLGLDIEDAPAADPSLAASQHLAAHHPAAEAPKVTAHTVAHLAAQVIQKAEGGKTTRFDVALNPEGLGQVDVRIEIGAQGQVTAQMNFDNPEAAAQMKARAGELQAALTQAGFDADQTQLSFNSGGASQDGLFRQQDQDQGRPSWTGRAFSQLADDADAAAIAPAWTRRGSAAGVDVRI